MHKTQSQDFAFMKDDPATNAEWMQREREIDQQWYDADEDGAVQQGNDLFASYQEEESELLKKEQEDLLIKKKQLAQPISKR